MLVLLPFSNDIHFDRSFLPPFYFMKCGDVGNITLDPWCTSR